MLIALRKLIKSRMEASLKEHVPVPHVGVCIPIKPAYLHADAHQLLIDNPSSEQGGIGST